MTNARTDVLAFFFRILSLAVHLSSFETGLIQSQFRSPIEMSSLGGKSAKTDESGDKASLPAKGGL